MILYSEGATQAQQDEANMILGALGVAYPGHPWAVRVYDGGFFITHLDFDPTWGMNYNARSGEHYSASAMQRKIILLAGEWLERANLRRGRYDDDQDPGRVEGLPERSQPLVRQ